MLGEKIVQWVEIDYDFCTEEFGVAPCMAALSINTPHKCFNSFPTCSYKQAYNKGVNTLRFIEPSYAVKDGNYIPALSSVSGREQEVNIAGFNNRAVGLGVRASVKINIKDFVDRDTLTDKYWNERMSGAAQYDGVGYDPMDRGSFWTKFKARNPNYAGRPLRVYEGHFTDAGALIADNVRHYVISDIAGPSGTGQVTIEAKDILSLADDAKAIAPVTSRGRVASEMDASQTTLTLTPTGIGAEYAASGYVTVGSEIMKFTRSGDVLTVDRGVLGTQAATHAVNDSVQEAFHVSLERADSVIRKLLIDYARIPSAYIDFAEWQAEFDRWGSTFVLSATICKPTGVAKLISEINNLGVTVWWDELAQKIRIKLNHPPEENPVSINDRNNIISIKQEDNDESRTTRVSLWTVQIDPTRELSNDNFLRNYITVFVDGENPNFYDEETTKTINTRWLNHGADAAAKIITGRLLLRYRTAPNTYTVVLDAKDNLKLTDVVSLESHVVTDVTGRSLPTLAQVFYRADTKAGSQITAKLQRFLYEARYGNITENDRPDYDNSTAEERLKGTYWVGPSLTFSDGSPAYRFI